MFENMYIKVPDVDAYLDRINAKRPVELTKEYLDHLILHHQMYMVYENIDQYKLGALMDLNIDKLFEKMVIKGYGGLCFELNGLFYALLETLGFEVYPCVCKVLLGIPGNHAEVNHRGTICIIDGKKYFCDVGFGTAQPSGGVELIPDIVQTFNGESFRFVENPLSKYNTDWFRLDMMLPGDEYLSTMLIYLNPYDQVDFVCQAFAICSGDTRVTYFKDKLLMNIRLPEGAASITGNVMKVHKNGQLREVLINDFGEYVDEISEIFNISKDRLACLCN